MSDSIILESRFTTHQKTHIILSIGAPFIIMIVLLLKMNLNQRGYIALFIFILIYSLMVCLAFTKRGILKEGSNLYRGLYFKNKRILKKKIGITDKSKISILKFKRSQKMAWFSVARPDLGSEFNAYDITLLNDKHTQKERLVSLSNNDIAEKTIEFLEAHFNLTYEIYSPDFS